MIGKKHRVECMVLRISSNRPCTPFHFAPIPVGILSVATQSRKATGPRSRQAPRITAPSAWRLVLRSLRSSPS